MIMTLILVYFTSLSILQIFYVTGDSVSWSSPSTIYSSKRSQSVPSYNGNLQQELTFSTIQPFGISGDTLRSQIDNLNTKKSSNIGLGKNSNTIFVRQVDQRGDNHDNNMSENIITNIQPSEMSSESSLSSTTTIPNFESPIHINGPGLSNIYHKINKISNINRLNEVNNLEQTSGSDEGFQLGDFSRLSGSISEDGLNLVDNTDGLNERYETNEKGLRTKYGGKIGKNEIYGVGNVDNYRLGHKLRKINLASGSDGSTELSFEAGEGANQGLIGEGKTKEFVELSSDDGGRMFIGNGERRRDRGFSASVGSIQLGRKNYGRASGSGGEEGEDKGFSRSNGSIRFSRKKKSGAGGSSGEEQEGREFSRSNASVQLGRKNGGRVGESNEEVVGEREHSRSNGSIRFNRQYKSETASLGGEEEGDIEVGRSNVSIQLGRQNGGIAGGSDGEERRNRGISRSNGSIRFSRKNNGITSRLGGEEKGAGRSNGSTRFGRNGGSGGEEKEGRGFSGSVGSIGLGRKNKSETGGSGGENIKLSDGQRAHRSSIFRGVSKMNGSGGKRIFGGSVGSITFGDESGDKGQSKSYSINTNRPIGNYGVERFDGYNEGNAFSKEYSTDKESDGGTFGEYRPEMVEKLKWID